jgi:hypothetical protein
MTVEPPDALAEVPLYAMPDQPPAADAEWERIASYVQGLERAVEMYAAKLEDTEMAVDDLQIRLERARSGSGGGDASSSGAAFHMPAFATPQEWIDGWLMRTIERTTGGGLRWCSAWQQHPEAALRITLMHQDWNDCRANPALGINAFLRNSFDYHFDTLTSAIGPFAACRPARHEDPTFLDGEAAD